MRLIVVLLLALSTLPLRAQDAPADFTALLQAHNAARSALGIAPLQWSAALADEAQQWAGLLQRESCALRYDPDPARREKTGQNLFRAFGSTPYEGYRRTSAEAAARWLREGEKYDHATHRCQPGLGSQCGAYLQMIWDTTTALGCGRARCERAEVWVCHYSPRGGQDDLKPYGNTPQQTPVAEPAPVLHCSAQGPTPAEQFSEAVGEKLAPP